MLVGPSRAKSMTVSFNSSERMFVALQSRCRPHNVLHSMLLHLVGARGGAIEYRVERSCNGIRKVLNSPVKALRAAA